jgi:hypothetical protein
MVLESYPEILHRFRMTKLLNLTLLTQMVKCSSSVSFSFRRGIAEAEAKSQNTQRVRCCQEPLALNHKPD